MLGSPFCLNLALPFHISAEISDAKAETIVETADKRESEIDNDEDGEGFTDENASNDEMQDGDDDDGLEANGK